MVNNMVEYLKSTPVDTTFKLKTGVGVEKFVDATKTVLILWQHQMHQKIIDCQPEDKYELRIKNGKHDFIV